MTCFRYWELYRTQITLQEVHRIFRTMGPWWSYVARYIAVRTKPICTREFRLSMEKHRLPVPDYLASINQSSPHHVTNLSTLLCCEITKLCNYISYSRLICFILQNLSPYSAVRLPVPSKQALVIVARIAACALGKHYSTLYNSCNWGTISLALVHDALQPLDITWPPATVTGCYVMWQSQCQAVIEEHSLQHIAPVPRALTLTFKIPALSLR